MTSSAAPTPTAPDTSNLDNSRQTPSESSDAISNCVLRNLFNILLHSRRGNHARKRVHEAAPTTPRDRLDASLNDKPVDVGDLIQTGGSGHGLEKPKTYLYLAYGSNLCNETFRDKRGIRPLSQINVVVPSLRLTFDLPGIPYQEPCFANTALRDPNAPDNSVGAADYHKNRWHKGLVGCVYEVTESDYVHIIATEGAGSAYKDIVVTCYPLPDASTVPDIPLTPPFKAHTLFAASSSSSSGTAPRITRPDPSYAQPSPRYLHLITSGACELALPAEYRAYLDDIRPYTITSTRQAIGQKMVMATWLPWIVLVFALQERFKDEKGRAPAWLAGLSGWIFWGVWRSYDDGFRRVFGEGERTEGVDEGGEETAGMAGKDVGWQVV
ncbi:hypothetical protein BDV95DRAFT_483046 [Massariosphaeria phaeospora]|uniref:gamma-glutamylcyclotransferase n=1 Tax=Massariosphaeria phaeospora TaxID=100035 RepID=A0A7C8IJX9_9PLEO|nr:hypothetical protein BDV95DRAFT_483046 [Massariosphaeria phaeospora]